MATFIHEPLVGAGGEDFVAGWNACLARRHLAASSPAGHSGWMACCAEAAKDNGSFLVVKPLVYVKLREAPPYNPFKRWL